MSSLDHWRTFACGVAVVSIAALIACGRDRASPAEDRTDVAVAPVHESTAAPDEIDRLRALGYLDYSPDPADPLESGVTRYDRERAQPGYTLVTIRHQDTIVLVDWDRIEVIWAWGRGEISGPHDATMLSNGNILVFDNGLGRGWSRVIEVEPDSGHIVWEYRAPQGQRFYTGFQGSAQRLANGNTLIAESRTGRVFEVTPAAEEVWDYHCPYLNDEYRRATLARARRYDARLVESLLDRFEGDRR